MKKILLVDDSEVMLAGMARFLNRRGFEVRTASSLAEGIAAMSDPFDVLVTDFELGDGYGTELVRAVRNGRPDAKIVLMSGLNDTGGKGLAEIAKEAGADIFIVKPISINVLNDLFAKWQIDGQ